MLNDKPTRWGVRGQNKLLGDWGGGGMGNNFCPYFWPLVNNFNINPPPLHYQWLTASY